MIRRCLCRVAAGLTVSLGLIGGAAAQNYDGSGIIRFGVF